MHHSPRASIAVSAANCDFARVNPIPESMWFGPPNNSLSLRNNSHWNHPPRSNTSARQWLIFNWYSPVGSFTHWAPLYVRCIIAGYFLFRILGGAGFLLILFGPEIIGYSLGPAALVLVRAFAESFSRRRQIADRVSFFCIPYCD